MRYESRDLQSALVPKNDNNLKSDNTLKTSIPVGCTDQSFKAKIQKL